MPITYVIDQERRLVITTGSGHLTASEIQAHAARLKADSRFDSAFRELVTLAYQALAMLARIFRYGRLSFQGNLFNLKTGRAAPILVDPMGWKRTQMAVSV
jgi:hypothetical protein